MNNLRPTSKAPCYQLMAILCLSLFCVAKSWAKKVQAMPYNLNVSTHLPSNHIYSTATDHLGYLWIATPKGVVRYNGYEARLFNVSTGLPSDDVWHLLEDKAGRMWLYSMSHELGYIQNNRYQAIIKNTKGLMIPRNMVWYKDGIAVINSVYQLSTGKNKQKLVLYSNASGLKVSDISAGLHQLYLNSDLELKGYFERSIMLSGIVTDKGLLWLPAKRIDDGELKKQGTNLIAKQLFRNRLYYIARNSDRFGFLNTDTRKTQEIICSFLQKDEKTVFGHIRDEHYTLASTKAIYLYDTLHQLKACYSFASLTGNEKRYDEQPCIFYDYPLWELTLGTTDMGIYIRSKDSAAFVPAPELDLEGYSFIGSPDSNRGVWWHPGKHEMKVMQEGAAARRLKAPYLDQVTRLSARIDGKVLLSTDRGYVWLPWGPSGFAPISKENSKEARASVHILVPAVALSSDSVFTIESGGPYSFTGYFKGEQRTLLLAYFNRMTADKKRYGIWLYRNQMIGFYDIKKDTLRCFYSDALQKIGLRKIEEIAVDEKYGNIFVKDYDGIYLVDEHFSSAQHLYPNLRCNNAQMQVENGRLVVAGRFGLLSCQITGKGRLGKEQWYENFKDIYYKQVYGLQTLETSAILNTDKGAYRVALQPTSPQAAPARKDPGYRFVAYTQDTTVRVKAHDTLMLRPGTLSVQWDVINPKGTGKPELTYIPEKDTGIWNVLPSNEMNVSGLRPGKWYKLYLIAKDDIWQSDRLPVYLYVQPHWWQTSSFLLLIVCSSMLLAALVVLITRKVVIRKQEQKRQIVEMGLAGIHSQINPHFVFNSLNTAQFFIKANQMREAYSHINRFSKLLRSFLHASRHKYITIEEEVTNLKNYIELQQTRFTEPFAYTINLSDELDTALKIPSLLLQPLVENAIQHGLFNRKEKGGVISLTFEKKKERLNITIEDNGIGREQARKIQHQAEKKESYGNDLIQKLIFVFNKYEKIDIKLSYIDKTGPETGTVVQVVISYPFI